MREVKQGDIVLYRPDRRSQEFHDKGHLRTLPAIVVKVWSSGAVNLRVATNETVEDKKVDLRVFLDHNAKDRDAYVWVFGAIYGEGQDHWTFPEEVRS